jgi:hypothetical protein
MVNKMKPINGTRNTIKSYTYTMCANVLRLRAVGGLEPICCHRKQMQFRKTIDKLTTKNPIDFSRCYALLQTVTRFYRNNFLKCLQKNVCNRKFFVTMFFRMSNEKMLK